jgi:hypothetical protein
VGDGKQLTEAAAELVVENCLAADAVTTGMRFGYRATVVTLTERRVGCAVTGGADYTSAKITY